MEPRRPSPHQSASDDLLAGYALGILTPAERAEIEARLAAQLELRQELALLSVAVDALPLGLEPQEPSPALRGRLEAAILSDLAASQPPPLSRVAPPAPLARPAAPTPLPRQEDIRAPRRLFPINAWAIAAAALLIIATSAVIWGIQQTQQAGQPARVIALVMTDPAAGGSGELTYLEESQVMLLTVNDLPPLPPDHVYEVWMIPHSGNPIPAGVFHDPTGRNAYAGSPDNYQAVAITVEPGPLGTTAPTSDPIASAPMAQQ